MPRTCKYPWHNILSPNSSKVINYNTTSKRYIINKNIRYEPVCATCHRRYNNTEQHNNKATAPSTSIINNNNTRCGRPPVAYKNACERTKRNKRKLLDVLISKIANNMRNDNDSMHELETM